MACQWASLFLKFSPTPNPGSLLMQDYKRGEWASLGPGYAFSGHRRELNRILETMELFKQSIEYVWWIISSMKPVMRNQGCWLRWPGSVWRAQGLGWLDRGILRTRDASCVLCTLHRREIASAYQWALMGQSIPQYKLGIIPILQKKLRVRRTKKAVELGRLFNSGSNE